MAVAATSRDRQRSTLLPLVREHWHAFEGYAEHQYFVDPCKLLLTTPAGINAASGEYEDFGVPATILANFLLRENGVVPEKCDLNSILFLLTPAEDAGEITRLVALLARFEKLLEADAPLAEVLPSIYKQHEAHAGYTRCVSFAGDARSHARHNVKQLQKEICLSKIAHFPRKVNIDHQRLALYLLISARRGRTGSPAAGSGRSYRG